MTKLRRGGCVFVTWKGDHSPRRAAVKIEQVSANNRKRAFEVRAASRALVFPYAKAVPAITPTDPVVEVSPDDELGCEGFTYRLLSGQEGTVHVEQVLEYDRDPAYMRDLLLYQLTVNAQERLVSSPLSRREIIRRLGTSPAQFYRLLDTANYRKSVDKMLELLQVLDCDVELVVTTRR
jgi:hypothetical protein